MARTKGSGACEQHKTNYFTFLVEIPILNKEEVNEKKSINFSSYSVGRIHCIIILRWHVFSANRHGSNHQSGERETATFGII